MEERLKMLEGKVDVAMQTLGQMDKVLAVVAQWLMVNKTFFDTLQVKAKEEIKLEEKK